MKVHYIGRFKKHFKRRVEPNSSLRKKFQERLSLFISSRQDPILQDHPLKGKRKSLRSFSITGDIRAIYYLDDGDLYFVDIGTHNQVY